MIERIDLFMPVRSRYDVLHHFTIKLCEALIRSGAKCRLLAAERENPKPFLDEIFSNPPTCTLSFNGLLPDEEGNFFCDMINIPHVACLVDTPNQFITLTRSPLSIITCSDKAGCDFFRGLNHQNVIFMPHGVDKNLAGPIENNRSYDVTLLASFIDYEHLSKSWASRFPPSVCNALNEAAEHTLLTPNITYYQAFVEAINRQVTKPGGIHPKDLDFIELLDELVMYIKGKGRADLVTSIKDANVTIFGSTSEGDRSWKDFLGSKHPNITTCDPIPHDQAIEVMKKSKIVLNNTPWVTHGAHERLFNGIACGALTLTDQNDYLSETFTNENNIAFYKKSSLNELNALVNTYLSDEQKRLSVVEKGREVVMRHHTWDHRAKQLILELEPILKHLS